MTLSKLSKGARSSLQGKVGPQGAPGPQGPRGIPGDQGATGPAGPSAVTQVSEVDGTGTWNSNFSEIPVAELQPTSGKYLLMATITLSRPTGTATDIPVTCQITNDLSGGLQIGGSGTQQVQTASDHQIFSNLTIAGAIDTQSTGEVNADFRIACKTNLVGDSTIYYVVNSFTATQVGAITTVDTNPFD